MRPRWIAFVLMIVILFGGGAFALYAWHSEISVVEPQARSVFDRALVKRGAQLALIGNCNTCHTKEGGAPYAGGRAIPTPFGTVYGTNITPDPDTGIGRWSEEAFRRSMHDGVRRDGAHLYPAFPYDHFTKLSTDDVRAIYAFLMTREPVRAPTPPNELAFPFNLRPLIAGWKLLYFARGEYRPVPARSAEWNRGAYLAEGLAHCGACHTPRNALGAEDQSRYFSGGEIESWHAPALNAASPAPVPWTSEQLSTYLRDGHVQPHGVAAGPMQPVVNNLNRIADEDVRAIATYVGSILGPATADRGGKAEEIRNRLEREASASTGREAAQTIGSTGATTKHSGGAAEGAIIYAGACALCHETTGQRFSARGIHLAFSKLLTMPDPRNLIHVIDEGILPPDGAPAAAMPGFAAAFTDQQVAALVNYLRSNFTEQPAWSDVESIVRKLRRQNDG